MTSSISSIPIAPVLKEMADVFKAHGKRAFLVGGAVRDILLKKKAADWDLATDALCEEVCAMFRRVIRTGIKHGTVSVLYKGHTVEVTTFRTDGAYSDGRHPDSVRFATTIEEDLSRRDFTMNAVAAELPLGNIVDPFNGVGDIDRKLIRCVGKAEERFNEDGLRPLRALRFASVLNFKLDDAIIKAIPAALDITARVSPERIRDEFEKILLSPKPSTALQAMAQTGLMHLLFPCLADCIGVEQKGYHSFDVFTHSVLACDYAAHINAGKEVRLASLLHDVGKPASMSQDECGIRTFYNHEKISAKLAADLMTHLRFPNLVIDKVVHLIDQHMFHYEEVWNDAAVRRFIARVGEEHLKDLFDLRRADSFAMSAREPPADLLLPLQLRIEDVLSKSRALSVKDLAINGRDLMAAGIPTGKDMGLILSLLLETVFEDPALNTKEKLLEIGLKLRQKLSS
ncbi:MAG: HD domain-containing protein [Spirochaetaceae bacterium]|jgi:tRNA nucleotidyltransferase/poly(A) polymerase|nr:HD domain-containing protein [Spirochaetaceae bacterium]